MPTLEPIAALTTPALCTLEQVKARLGSAGTWADARIEALIPAVAEAFNTRYQREFTPRRTRTVTLGVRSDHVDFAPFDLVAATAITLDGVDVTDDVKLLPVGGRETGTYTALLLPSIPDLNAELSITGSWGCWASVQDVPADVNAAAIETVLAWLDRSVQSVTGLQGGEPRQPYEVAPASWDIPLSAHRKMAAYARWPGGGAF